MAVGASFSVGLMGGFGHCTFMCGGFALSYTARAGRVGTSSGSVAWWLGWLQYHLGRWTTYGFLAFVLGLGGTVFEVSPAGRQAWAVALGLVLVAQAVTMWQPGLLNLVPKPISALGSAVAQRLSRALPPSGSLGLWGAGIAPGVSYPARECAVRAPRCLEPGPPLVPRTRFGRCCSWRG